MIEKLHKIDSLSINPTLWLNSDALKMMTHFGKPVGDTTGIEVNAIHNPVLFKYYIIGTQFNQSFYE